MSWDIIKTNLWKGGLGFSSMFPAAGKALGAFVPVYVLTKAFPKIKRRKR